MTDLLFDLMGDMKTCLLIALGSGVIFGYLYTKFKARERYKPKFKNLSQKIYNKKIESEKLLSQTKDVEKEVEEYNEKLHKKNLEITKQKNKINELESNRRLIETDEVKIKNQYKKQENILNDYKSEVESLKNDFGIDDVSRLQEHKESLITKGLKLEEIYKQKCDSYEGLYAEKTELKKETSDLSSKISSLNALINKKEFELSDKQNRLSTIRGELQIEFDNLIKTKEENEQKIEQYRKQLLSIKDKLSLS